MLIHPTIEKLESLRFTGMAKAFREQSEMENIDSLGFAERLGLLLAQKACREGYNAIYLRVSRIFETLSLAKGDGRYVKMLAAFAKADLLVLDDYDLAKLNQEQRHDLLEILEDRHQLKSSLVTSQLPLDHWHEQVGDPTMVDAILDRLVHNVHTIHLKGGSMRKKQISKNCEIKNSGQFLKKANSSLDKKQFQFLDTIKGKNVKVKTLASLRSDRVADFTGISGRFPPESPAGFDWNAWPI